MKKSHKIFLTVSLSIHSEDAMRRLGRELSACLEPGDALGLVGDLGAGKTRLVQGILEGLGASSPALSPTFSLVHEHADSRIPAAHFDFYRMNSPDEAIGLGWDDYLESGSVLLVEWADKFDGELMPPHTVWVSITATAETERTVKVS